MIDGFFSQTTLSVMDKPDPRLPQCGKCGMNKKCESGKMKTIGSFRKKIMIVSESPSSHEDEIGKPFSGASSKFLKKILYKFGVNMRKDCLLAHSISCCPSGKKLPTEKMSEMCWPSLLKLIKDRKPNVIILLGYLPTRNIINYSWNESVGPLLRWLGRAIPGEKLNAWLCPTYNKSHALSKKGTVVEKFFIEHIKQAVKKADSPPYKNYYSSYFGSKYSKKVKIILDAEQAAKQIKKFTEEGGPFAFDYETNMLKPEFTNARIISVSISNEKKTIAFPMHGVVENAFIQFLDSPKVKKIAANMKFEDRWSRQILRVSVRAFIWDTMIVGHLLDNRKGVTSLKFQTFVHTGSPSYDKHVKKYLQGGPGESNNIHKMDINDLLLYNGLDSLFTFMIYKEQKRRYGLL